MTQKDITFVADFLTEHFNEVSDTGFPIHDLVVFLLTIAESEKS